MNFFDVVNIIGSSIYFVFFIFYLWISRIPKTRSGAGYWALAILCVLVARLLLMFVVEPLGASTTESLYAFFIIVEKYLLVIGCIYFFREPLIFRHYLSILMILCVLWSTVIPLISDSFVLFSVAVTVFNIITLIWVAMIVYQHRHEFSENWMLVAALIAVMYALHWATYPWLRFNVDWAPYAFLMGNSFVLALHLSLITMVLVDFQNRLFKAEQIALDMAYHDPLTELNNKRYMEILFDQAAHQARNSGQQMALLYIDLDNFKPINDSAGHDVGDQVLQTIAKRLEKNSRANDICARIGGDEFVLIVTQIKKEQYVHNIAKSLIAALSAPIEINHKAYQVGASIGIALFPQHGYSIAKLLKVADKAMYQVKSTGKNAYRFAE